MIPQALWVLITTALSLTLINNALFIKAIQQVSVGVQWPRFDLQEGVLNAEVNKQMFSDVEEGSLSIYLLPLETAMV